MNLAYIDLENAPSLGWVWGKYEQDVIEFERDWYLLTFAVKWAGEKTVHTYALPDYKTFKKDVEDDSELVKDLWAVLDKADIVVAHNGDRFDILKANTRFVNYRLKPPSFYKTIDTLKIARKKFKFESNKLDDLGKYLGVGRKLAHTGFHLWRRCMLGDKKAFQEMRDYNAQDVILLEKVYEILNPWDESLPNATHYEGNPELCTRPGCGGRVMPEGHKFYQNGKRQQYQCKRCGAWSSGPLIKLRK